jgi:DtxR family transcriptional regulator, Mn-dependent transcriptional regulator
MDAAGSIRGVSEAGFHPPVEEYLETIQSLEEEGTTVIQARIAERLGRSAPTVSEMLDRLSADGYVRRAGRTIALTDEGREVAERVVRKHRLAERLLVDVIGLPWHKAHLEAGRWEHVISDEVEVLLVALLGNPTTCPHGNPIPGAPADESLRRQVSLASAEPGSTVRIARITEEVELDLAALTYLDQHGVVPGAAAVVGDRAPDGTVTLLVGDAAVGVGQALSRQVFVAPAALTDA